MTRFSRGRKKPGRKRSMAMNRREREKDFTQRSQSAQRTQRRGDSMRASMKSGAILLTGLLVTAGAVRAQEMQMSKQDAHSHMEGAMVKAQENAKDALVTLEQVQKIASESNPTLRQAEAEIRAAKARQQQAGLYPNPTVAYTGDEIRGGSVGEGNRDLFEQHTVPTRRTPEWDA